MTPDEFVRAYEGALASQRWAEAGGGTSVLARDAGGWKLLVEHLGPRT